jgi:hypothetical protein
MYDGSTMVVGVKAMTANALSATYLFNGFSIPAACQDLTNILLQNIADAHGHIDV